MIILNNAVSRESWKRSQGPSVGVGGAGSEGTGSCRRGWAELGQPGWPGSLGWEQTEARARTCLPTPGWGIPELQPGQGAFAGKMARGNPLAEGGALENGNLPKFWRG